MPDAGSCCTRRRLGAVWLALCPGTAAQGSPFEPKQLNLPPRSGDGPPQGNAFRGTATGSNGMVACAHPLAAQAGVRTLAAGGNAIDAGIAVAAALNVVEPFMSGLGGGGWMQVYHAASGEHKVLDYCGQCPAGADLATGRFDSSTKALGILAPVIPGSPAGWLAMLDRYGSGKLTTAQIFQPAIELAEGGYPLTKFGADHFPGPGPYATAERFGDILVQPELAQTYRELAAGGAECFYSGSIAVKIVAFMEEGSGLITAADLAGYQPRWLEPVTTSYRGYTIAACPPSNHGTQILQTLNMLEAWDLNSLGHNSAEHLHLFLETMKRAAADRAVWRSPDTASALLSKDYAVERRAGIGLASKPTPSATQAGGFRGGGESAADAGNPVDWLERYGSTTHFDVVDRAGNALSCTHSLGGGYGCGLVVPGAGFALNNFMKWADLDPQSPASIAPGRLASETDISCMSPIMIFSGKEQPWLNDPQREELRFALGTPGSFGIPQTTTQLICNLLDFKMDMQEAIEAPRVSLPYETQGVDHPSALTINVEGRIPAKVVGALAERGHVINPKAAWDPFFGGMQGVEVHTRQGVGAGRALSGGADPRRDGVAMGY